MGELVLLVLNGEPPLTLVEALTASGLAFERCGGVAAAQRVNAGQIVLCERVLGWQALVARVDAAGGAAILLGEAPREEELPHLLPSSMEHAQTEWEVIEAISRVRGRLACSKESTQVTRILLERAESAELVNRFAQSIANQLDLPHVVHEAMARARELCEADGASLLLVDHQTGELYFDVVSGGAGGSIQRIRLRSGQGIAGRVASRSMPMLVKDAQTHPDVDLSFDTQSGFHTGSLIAVPLLFSGDVIGVLEAVRSVDRQGFHEGHLRRLEDLAPHVTIAVHNAQMTTQLKETQAQVMIANADLERKVRERTEQIARAKQEWEQTFDAINEPIALVEDFTVRRANIAYARKVGLSITEVPGRKCHEIFAGRDSPCQGCPLVEKSGELSGEVTIEENNYVFSGFRMAEKSLDTVVVHYRDVTGQRSLERKLRDTERLAAVGQLASGAAHEINNPLGFLTSNMRSLKGYLEELAEHPAAQVEEIRELVEDGTQMLNESLEGARRVAEIVRGLRELARLEIGRCEPTQVNPSITRAVRAEFGADLSKVDLRLASAATVAVPPLQLDQALGHLLRNARQAINDEGRIRVQTVDDSQDVRIEIEDEGCGIGHDILHRIFEPFFTTRGVGKGIGLGLTAAYGIVRRYGGDILVTSTPGKGSLFRIRLPRADAERLSPSASPSV